MSYLIVSSFDPKTGRSHYADSSIHPHIWRTGSIFSTFVKPCDYLGMFISGVYSGGIRINGSVMSGKYYGAIDYADKKYGSDVLWKMSREERTPLLLNALAEWKDTYGKFVVRAKEYDSFVKSFGTHTWRQTDSIEDSKVFTSLFNAKRTKDRAEMLSGVEYVVIDIGKESKHE